MQDTISKNKAPKATAKPKILEKHGHSRTDPYHWLNDRNNAEVIQYLEDENAYYESYMAHTKDLQQHLFEEMKSRIKEEDSSVPYKKNGYWYCTRFEKGKDYPIHTRKKENLDSKEEILFDCNIEAEGHSYFSMSGVVVSPNNELVAYGTDTQSRRLYTIRFKNLKTGSLFPERITDTSGTGAWAADNKSFFYTKKDKTTLRTDRIYKHTLGTPVEEDVEVYHEADDTFATFVYKSKSSAYIVIASVSTLTTEYRVLKADDPNGQFKIIQKRTRGLEYNIFHYKNHFYILTNADQAENFKLMKTPTDQTDMQYWEEVIPHRSDVLLEGVNIFEDYLVISERKAGLCQLFIQRWDNTASYYLPFESETYTAAIGVNLDFKTNILRFSYSDLITPSSVIDFDMKTKTKTIKKEQEVLGGSFQKQNYLSERLWATAADGTKIPISIVYRKGITKNSKNPLLQYGYGAYGAIMDPCFSSLRLSLLDRGFIFAIAHVRGSEYMGRSWYEDGKLRKKKNTFTDFIACSEFLIQEGYSTTSHLYAMGGSAGGLLIGAVLNLRPDLYKGAIASVPFVDVVTTMLDDSIPLTTGEYDEWGDPNQEESYNYMLSYSPYDQVKAQNYPNLLVTTGLHDSQVQYWEPAKWVAKLRSTKTGNNILLLQTNMDTGHGGASGRFEAIKEVAEEYAFLLNLEGKLEIS